MGFNETTFAVEFQQLITDWPGLLDQLHFLRPDWFYAFIPLFLYLLFALRTTRKDSHWRGIIDPQLLPFVLSKSSMRKRRYPLLLVLIACSLCITSLAGPAYKKLPQPVYSEYSSLVILLDLSHSMNAGDIKPSRLARAKLELLDLLKTRKTGHTALLVYAADAFVVTPLTDDNATIANLIPSLTTDMMPAQGSNLSAALAKAVSLLSQGGTINGDILVVTDDIHQQDESAIKKVLSQGHRLSVFGIGTAQGAPIPLSDELGGFLQDRNGAIVIPKLDASKLQRFALTGGGLYTSLTANDDDIEKLARLFNSSTTQNEQQGENHIQQNDLQADTWQEEGHWLLLPLLLLAALWARRGWIAGLVIIVASTLNPVASPAHAETGNTLNADTLWFSRDQQAMKDFNKGDIDAAAEKFESPEWKASALYRKGDYAAAAELLNDIETPDSLYNKGNALAKAGQLQDAIKAYDKAIELDADNEDAFYNREQVKQALQQEQQQQNGQQGEDSQENSEQGQQQDQQQNGEQQGDQQGEQQQDDEQQGDQQGEQQNKSDGSQESQQKQQQPQNQPNANQQDAKPQDNDQQSPENKQQTGQQNKEQEQEELKQRDARQEAEKAEQEKQDYEQQATNNPHTETGIPPEVEHKDGEEPPAEVEVNPVEASITEEEKATEQWLKRIPDDPGGLLRRKFYYQYNTSGKQQESDQPW